MAIRNSVIGLHQYPDQNKADVQTYYDAYLASNGKVEHIVIEAMKIGNNGVIELIAENNLATNYSAVNHAWYLNYAHRVILSLSGRLDGGNNEGLAFSDATTRQANIDFVVNFINNEVAAGRAIYGFNMNIEPISDIANIQNYHDFVNGVKNGANVPVTIDGHWVADPNTSGVEWENIDYRKGGFLNFSTEDLITNGLTRDYKQIYDTFSEWGSPTDVSLINVGHARPELADAIFDYYNNNESGVDPVEDVGYTIGAFAGYYRKGSYLLYGQKGNVSGNNIPFTQLDTGGVYNSLYSSATRDTQSQQLFAQEVGQDDNAVTLNIVDIVDNGQGKCRINFAADYHNTSQNGGTLSNDKILTYNEHIVISGSSVGAYNVEHKITAWPRRNPVQNINTWVDTDIDYVADDTVNNPTAQFVYQLIVGDSIYVDTLRNSLEAKGAKYFRLWFGGSNFMNSSADTEPQDLTSFSYGANTTPASAANTTITASPLGLDIGQTSTVTVTYYDAAGLVTQGDGNEVLALTPVGGTLTNEQTTFTGKTYTYTAQSSDNNSVSGTLGGSPISSTLTFSVSDPNAEQADSFTYMRTGKSGYPAFELSHYKGSFTNFSAIGNIPKLTKHSWLTLENSEAGYAAGDYRWNPSTQLFEIKSSSSSSGSVTKEDIGLGNVDNTSDLNKPISTATQNALNTKAETTYVDTQVANLVDSAPATLDTLNELSAALGDDENFANTITNQLANKQDVLTQVTPAEITAGTETALRSYSPSDVKAMVEEFDGETGFVTVGLAGSKADYDASTGVTNIHTVSEAVADTNNNEVHILPGTYTYTSTGANKSPRIVPQSGQTIRGAGIGKTILQGGIEADWGIYVNTNVTNVTIEGITFDLNNTTTASAIQFQECDDILIKKCEFKNGAGGSWFVRLGTEPSLTATARSKNIVLEDCVFDTHTGSLEMLLIFNAENIKLIRPIFKNKVGTGPTLGLWQKTKNVTIEEPYFENCAGEALYYSISCEDTKIIRPYFKNSGGIRGANVSDNGLLGELNAKGLYIENPIFKGDTNSENSVAITLGAVDDVKITNPVIDHYLIAFKFTYSGETGDGAGGTVKSEVNPTNVTITNPKITDMNPLGVSLSLNTTFQFLNGGSFKTRVIGGVVHSNRRPISFNTAAAAEYNDIDFVNVEFTGGDNSFSSLRLNDSVTANTSTVCLLDCKNVVLSEEYIKDSINKPTSSITLKKDDDTADYNTADYPEDDQAWDAAIAYALANNIQDIDIYGEFKFATRVGFPDQVLNLNFWSKGNTPAKITFKDGTAETFLFVNDNRTENLTFNGIDFDAKGYDLVVGQERGLIALQKRNRNVYFNDCTFQNVWCPKTLKWALKIGDITDTAINSKEDYYIEKSSYVQFHRCKFLNNDTNSFETLLFINADETCGVFDCYFEGNILRNADEVSFYPNIQGSKYHRNTHNHTNGTFFGAKDFSALDIKGNTFRYRKSYNLVIGSEFNHTATNSNKDTSPHWNQYVSGGSGTVPTTLYSTDDNEASFTTQGTYTYSGIRSANSVSWKAGQEYVVSGYVQADTANTNLNIYLGAGAGPATQIFNIANADEWYFYEFTVTAPTDVDRDVYFRTNSHSGTGVKITLRRPQIVEGNTPLPYRPAPLTDKVAFELRDGRDTVIDSSNIFIDESGGNNTAVLITDTNGSDVNISAADETERLALTGLAVGDKVKQHDTNEIYILDALPESTAGNWSLSVVVKTPYDNWIQLEDGTEGVTISPKSIRGFRDGIKIATEDLERDLQMSNIKIKDVDIDSVERPITIGNTGKDLYSEPTDIKVEIDGVNITNWTGTNRGAVEVVGFQGDAYLPADVNSVKVDIRNTYIEPRTSGTNSSIQADGATINDLGGNTFTTSGTLGERAVDNNGVINIKEGKPLGFVTVGTAGSGADFEVDGTDDHVQLQEANDFLALQGGGVIKPLSDLSDIEVNQLSFSSGVSIIADKQVTFTAKTSGATDPVFLRWEGTAGTKHKNVTLKNIKFVDTNRFAIGNEITTNTVGVVFAHCDGVTIENCETEMWHTPYKVRNSKNVRFIGNKDQTGEAATSNGSKKLLECQDVENLYAHYNEAKINDTTFRLAGVRHAEISNNTWYYSSIEISNYENNGYSGDILVANNTILENNSNAIGLLLDNNISGATLDANTLLVDGYKSGCHNIRIINNTVELADVTGKTPNGIYLSGTYAPDNDSVISEILIDGNNIKCPEAIANSTSNFGITASNDNTNGKNNIVGLTITNNTVKNSHHYGIQLYNVIDYSVYGNRIINCNQAGGGDRWDKAGISVWGTSGKKSKAGVIHSNHIDMKNTTLSYGIFFDNRFVEVLDITSNKIFNTADIKIKSQEDNNWNKVRVLNNPGYIKPIITATAQTLKTGTNLINLTTANTQNLDSANYQEGDKIIVKDTSGTAATNNITIDTSGAETIDGAATLVMDTDYQSVTLIFDGTNFFVI